MIDLDANATSALSSAARTAMLELTELLALGGGNPSSLHAPGQRVRAHIERARTQVSTALGGTRGKVVFTSGATEANAHVWHGLLDPLLAAGQPVRVVTTPVEHPSIRALTRAFAARGATIVELPVLPDGRLDPASWPEIFAQPVTLTSVMAVQNELGLHYPVPTLASWTHKAGGRLHTDATQAPGRVPVDLAVWDVDFASVSAHKVGGLAGTGAVWIRRGVGLGTWLAGHQEDGLRGGTENALGIVAMGAAFAEVPERLAAGVQLRALRDQLWRDLADIPGVRRHAHVDASEETGHVLSLAFDGVDGARLVRALDLEGISASSGAACASGTAEPSHVLQALGLSPAEARQGLRLSLGPALTAAALAPVAPLLRSVVARIRALR